MKKLSTLLVFFTVTINLFASNLDTLYLHNGEKIPCIIGRIGEKNILYLTVGGTQYTKINKSEVKDYFIGDSFFNMDSSKNFSTEKILHFPGYNQKEIYEALQDWIMINQRFILSNGINYSNDEFSIVVGTLYTKEFYDLDLLTAIAISILEASSSDQPDVNNINTYYVKYEVIIRAKNDRAKVYIQNLSIESGYDNSYSRPFEELFIRRVNRDGSPTNNLNAIKEIKKLLKEQLSSIEQHVQNVRMNNTYENNLIKNLLLDDNW